MIMRRSRRPAAAIAIARGGGARVDFARMAFTSFEGADFAFETVALASLPEFAKRAIAAGRVPCAYLRASWCPANVKLERSLGDPRMGEALREVAVAVFDVDDGVDELIAAGLDGRSVPVFFLLGADGKPTGANISGAAWGENTPENMGPPLGRFFDKARGERRVVAAPGSRGAYAAPVAAPGAAGERSARSRLGTVLLVVLALGAIAAGAWWRVSTEEASRKEQDEVEQRERIRKDVDASIKSALKKQ